MEFNKDEIEKIVNDLELIETIIPSYKWGRRGLKDEKTEKIVYEALSKAIEILENIHESTITNYKNNNENLHNI